MEYKVLVKVYFPIQEVDFECFIPTNKSVYYVSKLLLQAVSKMSKSAINFNHIPIICNKRTGKIYDYNSLIVDTDIRNGCKLSIY